MVLKGRFRTDTITFFQDSNYLLSDALRFQRDLRYVSGLGSTSASNIVVPVVTTAILFIRTQEEWVPGNQIDW